MENCIVLSSLVNSPMCTHLCLPQAMVEGAWKDDKVLLTLCHGKPCHMPQRSRHSSKLHMGYLLVSRLIIVGKKAKEHSVKKGQIYVKRIDIKTRKLSIHVATNLQCTAWLYASTSSARPEPRVTGYQS